MERRDDGRFDSSEAPETQAERKLDPKLAVMDFGSRLKGNMRGSSLWQEIGGSLGDLGTFVPILLALAYVNGIDLGTTLIFTGIYNILTGLLFGVPMPVQPMKAIAAVALAPGEALTVPQIMAAGLSTGAVLTFLGITQLMTLVQVLVPLPVVRGIQLSQGLSFGTLAVKYIMKNQNFKKNKSLNNRPWEGPDGRWLALAACVFIIFMTGPGGGRKCGSCGPAEETEQVESEQIESSKKRKGIARWERLIPSALMVFVAGVVIAIVRHPSVVRSLSLGPHHISVVKISRHDWRVGFVRAAVPQIPLSLLNSVIATCKLSNDLFPERIVSPLTVSTSVGLMNLVGCWFGVMPVCHGAGGLAGQFKFGARSGLAPVLLGSLKLVLGLLLGSSLLRLLAYFPIGLLGTLLLFSGIELAMACRDQNTNEDAFVMLIVTAAALYKNASIGFASGMGAWLLLRLREAPTEYPNWMQWFKKQEYPNWLTWLFRPCGRLCP